MGDREAAAGELGEERLDVAEAGAAGGGIADMADRRRARQLAHHLVLAKDPGDMAGAAMAVEYPAVIAGDPGRFLAAMLERVQPERDERRGAVRAPQAEHAAFLAELVRAFWVEGVAAVHLARWKAGLRGPIVRPLTFVAPDEEA